MTTGLRIAVASSGLGHIARGIEAWASDLGRALADRGERVTLFKGGGRAGAPHEVVLPCWQRGAAGTRRLMRCLPRRGLWRLGLGSAYDVEQRTFSLNLVGELRRRRIDVLHVQDSGVAAVARWARRLGLVRTATVLAHGTNESLEFLARFPYVQHLAPWHLDQARQAGVWRPTWTAIPNFIDTDLFRPGRSDRLRSELGIPPGAPVVLTAAAIKRDHKRIDHLIEEFGRLPVGGASAPATLVVAGGREAQTDELVALGRERLGDRVRFLVSFPRERMPELYRLADVFVLCSLREMMPIALIEAAASGLPCVVHRHPIMEWMAGPGGWAVDMAAPGELALALARLCADPGARVGLAARAREHCLANFGRDQVVGRVLDYYRLVAADSRARRSVPRPAAA